MRLAVLTAERRFTIEEAPVPEPGPDEVLVRVAACGVCASDLDVWQGVGQPDYPRHLGHEVSGTVVAAGPQVQALVEGDRVGVWVTTHGYADYVAVPETHCRTVGAVALDTALLEPLGCAVNAVERADVRLGDDVVVVGAGFMGNLVQQLVALRGPARVVVADTRADALARAATLGADRTVDVTQESLRDAVAERTDGRGADVTFECTGTQRALDGLGDVTRMSGRLVLVGFHQGPPREIPLGHWNWMAYDIVNGHFRDEAVILGGMTAGARLLTAGSLSLADLVTHRFGPDDIDTAFGTALAKPAGFAKATVVFAP